MSEYDVCPETGEVLLWKPGTSRREMDKKNFEQKKRGLERIHRPPRTSTQNIKKLNEKNERRDRHKRRINLDAWIKNLKKNYFNVKIIKFEDFEEYVPIAIVSTKKVRELCEPHCYCEFKFTFEGESEPNNETSKRFGGRCYFCGTY